jgi:hypothetical protein
VATLNVELGSKRLELLHELAPTATVIVALVNRTNPNVETLSRDFGGRGSHRGTGDPIVGLRLITVSSLDPVLGVLVRQELSFSTIGSK